MKRNITRSSVSFLICAVVLAIAVQTVHLQTKKESLAQSPQDVRDRRMQWWREARFGMFIHWGVYSVPAGEWKGKPVAGLGEWVMNHAQIPVPEYEQLTRQFDPEKFDAEEWVRIAKNAGMKYIVITSKQHHCFSMFGSNVRQ